MTYYCARPEVTVTEEQEEDITGVDPGGGDIPTGLLWEDVSTDDVPPLISFGAALAFGPDTSTQAIIIHGGLQYVDGAWEHPDTWTSPGTWGAYIDDDGDLVWEELTDPDQIRSECELVFIPSSRGNKFQGKLFLLGGYVFDPDAAVGNSYFADEEKGDMATYCSAWNGSWTNYSVRGYEENYQSMGGSSTGQLDAWTDALFSWAPRNGFIAGLVWPGRTGIGIVIACGASTADNDEAVWWKGPYSTLRDAWYSEDGTGSPELLTELSYAPPPDDDITISDDCGLGYRKMGCHFTIDSGSSYGEMFAGGGYLTDTEEWKRDLYKFVPSENSFTQVSSDITSRIIPSALSTNMSLTSLTYWRGRLMALVSKASDTSPAFLLLESFDYGATWRIAHKYSFPIAGVAAGVYKISGDYTDYIAEGDVITIIGTTAYLEYLVASVSYSSGYTLITLTENSQYPFVGGLPTVTSGTIYVNLISGWLAMTNFEKTGESPPAQYTPAVRMFALEDQLYVLGGKNDLGKFQVWRTTEA